MTAPARAYPSSEVPTVVLPEPDSPTRPTTSPGRRTRSMSSTTSTGRAGQGDAEVLDDEAPGRRRLVLGVWTGGGHQSSPSLADLGETVGHQVGADREDRDHQHRRHHRPRLGGQAEPVLVHHLAPVGRARVGREAQEAQGGDQADRVGQPQAGLREQRPGHVGQHLGDDDAGPPLAQRLGRDHEVTGDDAERDTARDAGHARGVGDADQHDDHPRGGVLERGQHDQGQQDLREGEQHVVEAA